MAELWSKNRQIRASKIKCFDATESGAFDATKSTWGLAHNGPYKMGLDVNQKAAPNSSSHCAMIHVPPMPLLDGKTNFSSIQCDLVIRGTFEVDYTAPKDCKSHSAYGALGEIWDDCVDFAKCPFGGYGMANFCKSRVQWVSGIAQYIKKYQLKAVDKNLKVFI
ncbi:hypothetical protein DAPPUDRAFT_317656 [Daphnia pulex]|uniref:Uncharacterized protein n=1 Tax=Daphnia pulex TaxID=6669 RepID=E9GGL6_DAPPU|nr:hypothetical protein DAPPUDRAFT_317656 [Daphnia pulex]|eukprot:EFX81413.1 hypothetical protein DAPPUDRAFT_317656 [Daphnia pulex]